MKIGEILKQARIEKGLTLSQIARDLFVQEKYLRALEEGEYDIIPYEAYQRAYFRTYAEYLGLADYIESLTRPHRFSPDSEEQPVDGIFDGVWDGWRMARVFLKLVVVPVVIILIIMAIVRASHPGNENRPRPDRVSSTQPTLTVVPIDSRPSWQTPESGVSTGAPESLNNSEYEIKLTALCQCWVVCNTRDRKLYTGLMVAGETLSFTDPIGFSVFAGKPECLDVFFEGRTLRWNSGQNRVILPENAPVPESLPD
jgi:cytoskeletal protein RodZ